MHQHVEPAETLIEAGTDRIDRLALGEVERQQGRGPAGGTHEIVGFLQPALGARGEHDMRAVAGERHRARRAEPAAGAGDQRHRAVERTRHQRSSASRLSWRSALSPWSGSAIG